MCPGSCVKPLRLRKVSDNGGRISGAFLGAAASLLQQHRRQIERPGRIKPGTLGEREEEEEEELEAASERPRHTKSLPP